MEGLFHTDRKCSDGILGQPDVPNQRLDNPLVIPAHVEFSHLSKHGLLKWMASTSFRNPNGPTILPLLYFSYHIMVGLGTLFIAILVVSACVFVVRGKLYGSKFMLWTLMLTLPFPFIANTAGWITAEVGRQPWIIYGLMRTRAGVSCEVSAGSAWFTLLGFLGMYTILGILFLFPRISRNRSWPRTAEHSREDEGLLSH